MLLFAMAFVKMHNLPVAQYRSADQRQRQSTTRRWLMMRTAQVSCILMECICHNQEAYRNQN
jgi:hypothetical protein